MSERKTKDTIAILTTGRIQYNDYLWNFNSTFSFSFVITDNTMGRIQKWLYIINLIGIDLLIPNIF